MHKPTVAEYGSWKKSANLGINLTLRIVQRDFRGSLEGSVFIFEVVIDLEIRGITIWKCPQYFADFTNNFLYS